MSSGLRIQICPATLIPPTLTVQVKQNKPLRSLDAVKQKCALAVNTVGRRLCKQAQLVLRRTVCGRPFPVWVPFAAAAAAAAPSSRAHAAVVAAGEEILITLSGAEQPHARDELCMSALAQASVRDILNNIVGINVCRSWKSSQTSNESKTNKTTRMQKIMTLQKCVLRLQEIFVHVLFVPPHHWHQTTQNSQFSGATASR